MNMQRDMRKSWRMKGERHREVLYFAMWSGRPGGSDAYNEGDPGWIPGLGRFPGEENDNPLQYSCLENPMGARACGRLQSLGSQRIRHD